MGRPLRLKNDKFRRQRGGTAKLLLISCAKCGRVFFLYQKDGNGALKRCYLDRIMAETEPDGTPIEQNERAPVGHRPLTCGGCGELIGTPMIRRSGRPALRLRPGSCRKRTANALRRDRRG